MPGQAEQEVAEVAAVTRGTHHDGDTTRACCALWHKSRTSGRTVCPSPAIPLSATVPSPAPAGGQHPEPPGSRQGPQQYCVPSLGDKQSCHQTGHRGTCRSLGTGRRVPVANCPLCLLVTTLCHPVTTPCPSNTLLCWRRTPGAPGGHGSTSRSVWAAQCQRWGDTRVSPCTHGSGGSAHAAPWGWSGESQGKGCPCTPIGGHPAG